MSVRTERLDVALTRGSPQLSAVHGFVWQQADPENSVASTARVRVEMEYRSGRTELATLRNGVWYGSDDDMLTRVWFVSDVAGIIVLDVGSEPGDRVDSSGGIVIPSPVNAWHGPLFNPLLAPLADWNLSFRVPYGANKGTLWLTNVSPNQVSIRDIQYYDDAGVQRQAGADIAGATQMVVGANMGLSYKPIMRWGVSAPSAGCDSQQNVAVPSLILQTADAPPREVRITLRNTGAADIAAMALHVGAHWWS